jgi:glycosyltransferase involved in cell wall biosynthesis
MKIGIDAKWYFEGPPSGKRVIRALVDSLLASDDGNEYYIFLNRRHRKEIFPWQGRENVTCCYVWAGNNLLSNLFLLPRYTFKYPVDVILYQNFTSPFGRGKAIAYVHDVLFLSNPEYYTITERIYLSPLKFLARTADAIITVSGEEKKRLLQFRLCDDERKISVVYHGVDRVFVAQDQHKPETVQRIRSMYHLPERFILFVGRLNLRKNVDHLLRAIPLLKDRTIPLVIVGADDWKKSNHMSIIAELGIGDRILFAGAVYEELEVVYSCATVFCFPSYAESFGLPPLEAMACGVPVVVSHTTSLPEVCGEAGTYVTPDHPEEIAAAIDSLLSNDQLYEEKRQLGLKQAKKFTWEMAAKGVLDCMTSCVKNEF